MARVSASLEQVNLAMVRLTDLRDTLGDWPGFQYKGAIDHEPANGASAGSNHRALDSPTEGAGAGGPCRKNARGDRDDGSPTPRGLLGL
jgi:hypothetical protein